MTAARNLLTRNVVLYFSRFGVNDVKCGICVSLLNIDSRVTEIWKWPVLSGCCIRLIKHFMQDRNDSIPKS